MHAVSRWSVWIGIGGLMIGGVGCQGDGDGVDPDAISTALVAKLHRAESCDDLLSRIQADAIRKLHQQAEQLAEGVSAQHGTGTSWDDADFVSRDPVLLNGSGPASAPLPSAGSAEGFDGALQGGATGDSGGGSVGGTREDVSYSDTNTQIEGVDEADIVKTDGESLYLLHGGQLFVLDAFPAESTSVRSEGSVEGQAVELFVRDGRAVVFSRVYLDRASTSGTSEPSAGPAFIDCWDCHYYGQTHTKITVIDTRGESQQVERELYLEGNYLSSRRHGARVRAVIQGGFKAPQLFYPDITYHDAWGRPYDEQAIQTQIDAWRDRIEDDIRATELSDWLPEELERQDDALVALERRCRDFYVPAPGLTSPGMTQVALLDLDDLHAPLGGALILGDASEVYSNHQTLLLSHRDWRGTWGGPLGGLWGGAVDDADEPAERTALHLFELEGDRTRYQASGFVPGYILNQFSMDERDGVVRLATTQSQRVDPDAEPGSSDFWRTTTVNHVRTFGAAGDKLELLGETEPLAPNEQVFSARFLGDRGYVVTFERVDPLFVVDLSDPSEPLVLGELKIPGFSDYMHPLDDDHLLTIGREVDEQTGRDLGLLLQIFDVSDPVDPQVAHRLVFERQGYSEANHNHKAFTFWAERGLLAFPFVSYSPQFLSTLELMRVSVDQGFEPLGSIDHAGLIEESCGPIYDRWSCGYGHEVRRGLFIEDAVYSISFGGILVHDLGDLSTPLAEVVLPMHGNNWDGPFWGGAAEPGWAGEDVGDDEVWEEGADPVPDAEDLDPDPVDPTETAADAGVALAA